MTAVDGGGGVRNLPCQEVVFLCSVLFAYLCTELA